MNKIVKAWTKKTFDGHMSIEYAYGFQPFPNRHYAEIVSTKNLAIAQFGKDNIIQITIKQA